MSSTEGSPGSAVTRVWSPSEWSRARSAGTLPGAPVRLGGRVVALEEASLTVADAFTQIHARLDGATRAELLVGDLVELELTLTSEAPVITQLHTRQANGRGGRLTEFQRLATTGRAYALRARAEARGAVRGYFEAEGFLEVETPTFVPCPGLDPHVHSLAEVRRGERVDHLITSPELHMKRLLVGGLPRIYQIAHCFRAEELGPLHEPEFTLIEWYRAFADFEEILTDTEELVRRVALTLTGRAELRVPSPAGLRSIDVTGRFARLTVAEAFARYADVADVPALIERDEARYFELLVDRIEPALRAFDVPVFLTHYPSAHAALARRTPGDPTTAERFELYAGGVELANGFGELTDAGEQRARFEAERTRRANAGEPVYPLDERFLGALEEGLPRSAGNALGLDRLIALALGEPEIQKTLAFPEEDR